VLGGDIVFSDSGRGGPGTAVDPTGTGIVESTDGGVSWSKPLALPKEVKGGGALTWIEYDPINNTLYAMKMGSQLYKLDRK
jgi:hypothetical protein